MENPNIAGGDLVAHEVQVDLHMLRPLMLDGVSGEIHGTDVVAVDERALGDQDASALDRETTGCCLDDQETRLLPRKTV